jgi:hypothetical protein
MEIHRTVHDFKDLTYEDIAESSRGPRPIISANPYYFLLAALAVGIFVGLLAKRK